MLEQLKSRLLPSATFEEVIATVLDDSIALLGAEYGNVQLPLGDDLVIVAQRGLLRPFLDAFRRVSMADGCACGRALRLGQSVIVTDVDTDPDFFLSSATRGAQDFARCKARRFLRGTADFSASYRLTSPNRIRRLTSKWMSCKNTGRSPPIAPINFWVRCRSQRKCKG